MKSFKSIFIIIMLITFFTITACADDIIFVSEEYGFKITFSETWTEYKAFLQFVEGSNNTKTPTFYVALPTEDPGWYSMVEEGYASIFAISAYTPERWEAIISNPDSRAGTEIGRNNNYVFVTSHAHACPDDLMDVFFNSDYTVEIFDTD